MEPLTIGFIGITALLLFIGLGVPIAFSITLVSATGMSLFLGWHATSVQLYNIALTTGTQFILISIPLFILMGQIVAEAGIGEDLYDAIHKWLGRVRGGLAITSVVSCAGFGAVTGVSGAAVGTMAAIAMPEMKKYGYGLRLSSGSVASAGTLAILVPPSIAMVIYGLWTETSIGELFIGGLVPAAIMVVAFSTYIYTRCLINPALGPVGPRFSWGERVRSLGKLTPILVIFVIVMGGIYGGIFTPGEAAGVGAAAVFVVALVMGRMTGERFMNAVNKTAELSIMIYAMFLSVNMMSRFLTLTEVTPTIIGMIADMQTSKYMILVAIVALYLVMGALLDAAGMMLLSLPFTFPIVMGLGFDPVWFGIIVTILAECALITPPVGINVYILNQVVPDIGLANIFAGTGPFVVVSLAVIFVLVMFPNLVLWLPILVFR